MGSGKGEAAAELRCWPGEAWRGQERPGEARRGLERLGSSYSHSLTYICLLEGWEGEGYWRKRP